MATDFFLKIDGIKGESKDKAHAHDIDVLSWSWGESQQGSSAAGGGRGVGRVNMSDFNITMEVNKASPKLMLCCATGEHIAKANLFCRKAGGKQEEYLKIELTDVLISSYQTSGGGNGLPVDNIAFNFAKIKFEYAAQNDKGALESPVIFGYDIKTNTKF